MEYQISYQKPLAHYIDIELTIRSVSTTNIYLQLPAWRPGRYELANFARNIRNLKAVGLKKEALSATKVTKDRWKVKTLGSSKITINYQYYANQMDAGGSFLDDQQLYINFINCLLYAEDRLLEPCKLSLHIPATYRIACGLPQPKPGLLQASNYYQLVDSPLIASSKLKQWSFQLKGVQFYLWFMGSHKLSKPKTIKAFKAFIVLQMDTMGGFPEKDYHFLFQIPINRFYHGVEHGNSTVIVLGPGAELHKQRYNDFLGVSSHELFHAWNILKIRPSALLPYDYRKENYFEEGFVAEGFTTYYGDLFLVRSGVFSQKQYFKELNTLFKKHFENDGRHHASLLDSSYDLWLDGYQMGAPGRKVSIYTKGALVALMLDLTIRKLTRQKFSLDDVMRVLWKEYGQQNRGYQTSDIQKICQSLCIENFQDFFNDFIKSNVPLEGQLNLLLEDVGCLLVKIPSKQILKRSFGIRTSLQNGSLRILQIASGSPAEDLLSAGDLIVKLNGKRVTKNLNKSLGKSSRLKLLLDRDGRELTVKLSKTSKRFFDQFKIHKLDKATEEQQSQYHKWVGQPFNKL